MSHIRMNRISIIYQQLQAAVPRHPKRICHVKHMSESCHPYETPQDNMSRRVTQTISILEWKDYSFSTNVSLKCRYGSVEGNNDSFEGKYGSCEGKHGSFEDKYGSFDVECGSFEGEYGSVD